MARAAVAPPVPPDAPPPLRSAGGDAPSDDGARTGGPLRVARSELRRQMRERRRLRLGVLVAVSVLLLGAVPAFFAIRTLSRDPVFGSLDELAVPTWAAQDPVDNVSGSRWCIQDCRLRERSASSERAPEETAPEYERALAAAGWQRWRVDRCPEQPAPGAYTCWRRDELTLDLWVRPPTCVPPPADDQPAVPPSPLPSPAAAGDCAGSLVSLKVRNAIDDDRTRPQPSTDPSLTGEDPFPTFTDDPLDDLTPAPSPS
ncbi:hypothetical protein JD81_03578 [Micromonospora sagamiensis]|uniref:Integrin beta 3 n=2 Tax=Micromonospora sagamiensis TaxID=47875 RepID=A0A562WIQ1_9ACTN|nr:hypothetical protein JD81_03578 [Micromonospora sagamiensis]